MPKRAKLARSYREIGKQPQISFISTSSSTVTGPIHPPSTPSHFKISSRIASRSMASMLSSFWFCALFTGHIVVEGLAVGPMQLAAIRRADVQRHITERTAKVSAGSVTKELNVLNHLLGLAVEWEVIAVNVARGIKPPRVPAGRVRYLQPGELAAWMGFSGRT